MGFYGAIVYPLVMAGFLVVFCVAGLTFIWTGLHRWLERSVTLVWVLTAIQAFAVIGQAIAGPTPDLFTTIGYLIVSVVLLPMFGIGRLGVPEPGAPRDPNRPVLNPRQVALVDSVVAMVLAVALAVVAWRLSEILAAAR